jgi:hypothetical protein
LCNIISSPCRFINYDIIKWRYVIFPYETIPNVTFPKLVIIPNIYTNPEIPNQLGEGERAKLGEGERAKLGEGERAKLGEGERAKLGAGERD